MKKGKLLWRIKFNLDEIERDRWYPIKGGMAYFRVTQDNQLEMYDELEDGGE